jgi:hypothetical protein
VGAFCLGGPAPISPLDIEATVPANSTFPVGYVRFHTSSQVTSAPVAISFSSTDTHIYEYGYLSNNVPIDSVEPNAPCDGDDNTALRACEDILMIASLTPISINVGAAPTNTPMPPTSTPVPPTSTPVPTSTPIPGAGPLLELSTPVSSVEVNSTFNVEIRVDSDGQYISGTDAVVDFNSTRFQVVSVAPNTGSTVFATFENNVAYGNLYYSNSLGKVDISGLVSTGNTSGVIATDELLATIALRAVGQTASSPITFFTDINNPNNDSNIAQSGTGLDILARTGNLTMTVTGAVPTSTPIPPTSTPVPPTSTPVPPTSTPIPPTSTPVPTNTPMPTITPVRNISLLITLEGRTWKSGILNRIINLYVFQNSLELTNMRVWGDATSVTDPTTGLLSNRLSLNVNGTYTVVVQPKGYLNQEVTQNITSSMSQIDMTANPFQAGDIDNSGKVNAPDVSQILSRFKVNNADITGATDDGTADLDGSGQVNSLDYSLLLSNFNTCGAYEDTTGDGVLDSKFGPSNPC